MRSLGAALVGLVHTLGVAAFKGLTRAICRVDDQQLEMVPDRGPLILVMNHVHIVELPLIYTHLQPRPVTALVAANRWERIWTRILVEETGSIPLRRGLPDVSALRRAEQALEEGNIVAIAPEGTRSGDGRLRRGKPGVALLALRSGAPIIPLVHYGSEDYKHNLARFRRSHFHIVVGEMFRIEAPTERPDRRMRRQITDEIMFRLAALLPATYRGAYSDLEEATEVFLVPT